MLKQRILLIVILVLAVAVAGISIWLYKGWVGAVPADDASSSPAETDGLPMVPVNEESVPPSATITIGTPHGIVTVNNFYKDALGVDADTYLIVNNPLYQITYDSSFGSFAVNVFDTSSSTVHEAEARLISLLGISPGDTCKLNISVYAPGDVRGIPLSFCNGAIQQ